MRRLTEWLRAARAPRHALAAETLAVLLVALAALALAWQAPGPITVEAGRSDEVLLTHFDSVERADGRAYRWSQRDASLRFPGLGVQDWRVTLVAAAGARPGGPPQLTIRAGGRVALHAAAADANFRAYTFTAPARDAPAGDLQLDIDVPLYRPEHDNRELGLAVDRIILDAPAPRGPPPLDWAALALAVAGGYATLRLRWSRRVAGGGAALGLLTLAGLVAVAPLSVTPYAAYLPALAGLLFLGLYTLRATLARYAPPGTAGEGIALALAPALLLGYGLLTFAGQVTLLSRKPLPDDFVVFYRAAGRLAAGQPLYDAAQLLRNPLDATYKYPPLLAQALAPLSGLPLRQALDVWDAVSLLGLGVALFALLRAHGRRLRAAAPATLAALTLALLFQPAIDTLIAGQMDLILLGLLGLTYWALRSRRPGMAGGALAVATLLKLYPAALLIYLLLRREWRALGGFLAATAALLAGSLALNGVEPWRAFLTVALPHTGGATAWIENQSFAGFLARLLTDDITLAPVSSAAWQAGLLSAASPAWASGALALAVWAAWRPAPRESTRYALGFALFTALAVVALPNAWYHYLTLLILPLGIAMFALEETGGAWRRAWPRELPLVLAALAGAAALLTTGTYQVVWNGLNLGGPWKLGLSYKFYGEVLLAGALLWMLRHATVAVAADDAGARMGRRMIGPIRVIRPRGAHAARPAPTQSRPPVPAPGPAPAEGAAPAPD